MMKKPLFSARDETETGESQDIQIAFKRLFKYLEIHLKI